MKYYFFSFVVNNFDNGFQFGNGTAEIENGESLPIFELQKQIEEKSPTECAATILNYHEMSKADYQLYLEQQYKKQQEEMNNED